jgi:hypothetical protein
MTHCDDQLPAIKDWISECLHVCEERISVLSEQYSTEPILNGNIDDSKGTADLLEFEMDREELRIALDLINDWQPNGDGHFTMRLYHPNSYPRLNATERMVNLVQAEVEAFSIH